MCFLEGLVGTLVGRPPAHLPRAVSSESRTESFVSIEMASFDSFKTVPPDDLPICQEPTGENLLTFPIFTIRSFRKALYLLLE